MLALVAFAATFAAAAAPAAAAVTRAEARAAALEATKSERSGKPAILFGLGAPLRSGTAIREAGTRRPPTGAASRTMPVALRVKGGSAYFFYLDLGPYQHYQHPSRVLVVSKRTGKVRRSRLLNFQPVINGKLPAFLRSRRAYDRSIYRVFTSDYVVPGAARAAFDAQDAFGFGTRMRLRSAASEGALKSALAAEKSCTVSVASSLSSIEGGLASLGSTTGQTVLPLFRFSALGGKSLQSFIGSDVIATGGCKDVLIAISGDGYRSASEPTVRTGLALTSTKLREFHVTASLLRAIIAANPGTTFKFMIDAPGSGGFVDALKSLPNVRVIATSSKAGQPAFRYLPRKRIASNLVANPVRLRADSSFFTTQLLAATGFASSDAEVDNALAEVAAGRAPSVLAFMIARSFTLSGPYDFTADLGATPQLYVSFEVKPPGTGGPGNGAPTATAQAVAATEDTAKPITLAGSDPDGSALTFAIANNPAHGTLSGTAPNVTYTPAANYNGTDSFTFTVSDGLLVSAAATVSITVAAVDDPPTTTASGTLAYTENDPATAIAPALTVADVDSTNLTIASVQVTAGYQSGADVLSLPATPGITSAFDVATGTLTLSGIATVADYQAAMRAVRYANSSDNPTTADRTIAFKARDAGGFGPAATRTVTVAAVNDPPAIVTSAGPLSYTESDPATPVDTGLVLTDPDSQITGATIQIAANFAGAQDVLAMPAQPGITAAYNAATGVLTLSGTASVAAYQTALRAVTYRNTSTNPSTPQRTVRFVASDASSSSSPATRAININATNNAPDVDNSVGSLAYTENDPATPIDTIIAITDPDSLNLTGATAQITGNYVNGEDVLSLPAQPAINAVFDAPAGRLTLTGTATIAAYETALEAVRYRNTSDNPSTAPRTVTYQARDAGGFGLADTHGITIAAVDDPPVAMNDSATVAEDSGASAVAVLPNDTDVDAGPKSISSVTQPANGTVVVTGGGTGLTYAPNANYCNSPPATTPDTFTYTLTPGGSTATVSMAVTCIDDPPVAVTDNATVAEDSGASAVAVLVNDTDIDGGPKSVASVTQPANGAVVITGGGTGLTYAPNTDYCNSPPATSPDTFTYTLNGGSVATVSMTVICGDDDPVAVADSATVAEDSGASAVDVLANDTDPDGGIKQVISVTQPANGAVVVTGGGTGVSYTPNANYCNSPPGTTLDAFTYTLNGGSNATVSMTVTCVNDVPVADDETFGGAQAAVGNTAFVGDDPSDGPPSVAGPKKTITGDILAGDVDVDGPGPLVVTAGTFASDDGGTVVLESDGDFTFTPAAGTSCSDTSDFFDYTVSDQNPGTAGTDVGRVTIAITGCVWYVHNNAPGNAGTSTAPFDTLAQAESASASGHAIFVFDGDNTTTGYAAGIDLKAGQRLIGEAATLQIGTDLLHTAIPANRPTLTDSNADVVALAAGNTVRGVQLDPQGTGGGIAGGAGDAGGTIDDVRIVDTGTAGTQPSLELDATSGTFDVSSLTVDNSAATGTTSGSIGVRLNNAGTVNFASAGTVSITTSGARGMDATGPATSLGAGSVFDDLTVTGSGSGAVSMVNTTGTTTFSNLALTTTSGATAAFALNNAGTVTVPSGGTANVAATGGPAVDVISTTAANLDFDDADSTNSAGDGVNIDNGGIFTAGAGSSIAGAAGIAFDVNGGAGAIDYNGSIANGEGTTAEITGRTGSTVSLDGAITDTGDSDGTVESAISLGANTGGSTFLTGAKTLTTGEDNAIVMGTSDGHALTSSGAALAITTTTGKGIEATTSGTLNVTGAANTIDTGSGKALNVSNTDVGASPLAFVHIASNGANGGIVLDTTGANSALTVAGSGGTCTAASPGGCSGGVIQNATGADDGGALPTGTGVVLNNTRGISLTRMHIHDHSNYAVRGTNVVGLTMADSVINGSNGTSALTAHKDGSARFEELTGTVNVTNTEVSSGYFTNLMVDNTAGTLNATLDNVDSGTLNATGGDDAVQFEGIGTSAMNVDYKNSALTTASGDLFQYIGDGTGGGNLDLTGNTFTNNEPSINTGGGGVALVAGAKGAATMDVLNNTMRDSLTNALTIIKSRDAAAGTNNLVANIADNAIGVAGTANSGSLEGDGMEITTFGDGNATFNVTNNAIRQYNSSAIQFVAGSGVADTGQLNLNVSGNSAANPGTNPSITLLQGIRVDSGVDPADTFATCVNFGANSITGSSDAPNKDFRLVASQSTMLRQPGYAGGATDGAAFAAFAAAKIGGGAQGTAVANAPATFTGTGTTCP